MNIIFSFQSIRMMNIEEKHTWLQTFESAYPDPLNRSSQNTHKPGSDLLVKSHHMQYLREVEKTDQGREDLHWRMQNAVYFSGGGVLLIRNPYDAIR